MASCIRRFVLVTAVGLAACSVESADVEGEASTDSAALINCTGSVRDAIGDPVPAVRIELVDDRGTRVASGISAADGRYSLASKVRHIPKGHYSLVATPPAASGFSPRTFPDQAFDRSTELDVVLVELVPASVSGRVLDGANNPVAGQMACLVGAVLPRCANTGADGTFTLTAAAGEYIFELGGPLQQPGDAGGSLYSVQGAAFSASGLVALGDFKLETYKLRGEVRDENDVPVSSVIVHGTSDHPISIGNLSGALILQRMATDTNGKFQMTVLPFDGTLSASRYPGRFGSVRVASGQTDVLIRFQAPHHVTGRLLDATGNPLTHGTACLIGANYSCSAVSSDGRFDVSVPPGQYTLGFNDSLALTSPESSYLSIAKNTPVTVDSDVSLGDSRIELYELSGELRAADSQPVAGATVLADSLAVSFGDFSGTLSFTRTTDENGRFHTPVAPSSGELRALATGHASAVASLSLYQREVRLALPPSFRVSGRVVDRTRSPLAGQNVCLAGLGVPCAQSLADGTFDLVVAAGEYTLGLSGFLPEADDQVAASYEITRAHSLRVNRDTSLGDVKLPTRVLSARVLDPGARPVPASYVSASVEISFDDFSGSFRTNGTTAADGSYRALVLAGEATLNFAPVPSSDFIPFAIEHFAVANDVSVAISVQFPRAARARSSRL